jgi:LmbE family N-acetylglucosaminyl deacetylase
MKTVLVVAPHADDETLGCGGTILKLKAEGCELHWLLVTEMTVDGGFSSAQVDERNREISIVSEGYGFSQVHRLGFLPSQLDVMSKSALVSAISSVVSNIRPEIVYTVFRDDAHSDHEVVFDAVISATKIFRHPYVKRTLAYETLSETDFSLKPGLTAFRPNVFVNIEDYVEEKINLMKIFRSEIGEFPFPRSPKAIEALASLRGVQAGCLSAEAFMLLKEVD